MEKALELSRYCVPFTPFKRKLEEAVVCLVSTAGVRAKPDAPFNVEGDNSFRRIDASLSAAELAVDDAHYDHACIDKDVSITREDQVPMRDDLLELVEIEELEKYFTPEELVNHPARRS